MPYIRQSQREFYDYLTQFIKGSSIQSSGELNYLITLLLKEYIRYNGLSYQNINDVVGALEGAKLEFHRRVVVPYEDKKLKENGDV